MTMIKMMKHGRLNLKLNLTLGLVLLLANFGHGQLATAGGATLPPPELHAWFIDVGQGDSELVTLPNGKNVLIDGGPSYEATDAFLRVRGITHVDYMVMTHPHSDHYNGFVKVLDRVQVDHFYDNHLNEERSDQGQAPGNQGPYIVRDKIAADARIQVHYPRAGDLLDWDPDVRAEVLNSCPDRQISYDGKVINNCSIVIRMTYHGTSILFTGDAQLESMSRMITAYGDRLESAALKVGHHGATNAMSAEWLAKVRPRDAFIEVGAGNSYGHPTGPTLRLLAAAGVAVHRTDTGGNLEFVIR